MGGGRKQYQVLVDPAALLEYGVTLQEVERGAQGEQRQHQRRLLDSGRLEKPIRVIGRLGPRPEQVLADLQRRSPVEGDRPHARPVLLEQVARVVEGPQVKRGDASINGHPGVVLTVVKQPHADTRALTDAVDGGARARSSRRCPPTSSSTPSCSSCKGFIDRGIYNVGEALVIGAVLVLDRPVPVPAQLPHHVHLADGHPAVAGRHRAGVQADRLADRAPNCRST